MKACGLRTAKKLVFVFLLLGLLYPITSELFPPNSTISASASPDLTLSVDPINNTANIGEFFTVDINIADAVDLYGWSLELWWSTPVLLDIDRTNITEGPFLGNGGATLFSANAYTLSEFYITAACNLLPPIGRRPEFPYNEKVPQNGSGTLASATFEVIGPGRHTLEFRNVKIQRWNFSGGFPYEVPAEVVNGTFYTSTPFSKFTYSPDPSEQGNYGRPIVGETVTFNATQSYDPDQPFEGQVDPGITSYEWDFDGDDVTDATVSDPITTHVYGENDTYNVKLTVTDDEAESFSWERSVTINLHDIAIMNVIATPTEVLPGNIVEVNVTVMNVGSFTEYLNVTVYANDSPVNTTMFIWFDWQALPGGGGHWVQRNWLNAGDNETTTVTWDTTGFGGLYEIDASVTIVYPITHATNPLEAVPGLESDLANNSYEDGDVAIGSHDVAITNVVPDETEVTVGDVVDIDVTAANEGDFTESFTVTLYYDGDTIDTQDVVDLASGSSQVLPFSWDTTGVLPGVAYEISAEASTVTGETETEDNTLEDGEVTVNAPAGFPVANFTYSPEEPLVGQEVTFNASASEDPDGDIVSYEWDFDDGTIETYVEGVNLTAIANHTYTEAGNYTVTLTVTDNDDQASGMFDLITVYAYPVASFTYIPSEPETEELITFNATSSYDPDGGNATYPSGIVTYEWDFDDETTGTGNITTHTYTDFGEYNVTLTVTDNEDLVNSTWQLITVYAPPIANFTSSPTEPAVDQTVTFNASASEDPDGDIVSYKWDFDDGTKVLYKEANLTAIANHRFTEGGTFTVVLTVTDDDGLTNNTTEDITVTLAHDVAITDVTADPTTVSPGGSVSVTVKVKNEGNYAETFNVTAYYDTNKIGTKAANLDANATTTLTFTWQTLGVTEGTYTISAEADAVTDETDIEDNTFEDGEVTISSGGQPPPAQTLSIEFSGEREYSEDDDVKIRLEALVTYAGGPAPNADVTIGIFNPEGAPWISDIMVERLTGTGIYEWESNETIAELQLEIGFYLIHVRATLGSLQASEISQFRIVPPEKVSSIITIDADPASVTAGSNIDISGVLIPKRSGVTVTIQYRGIGGTWSELRSVSTSTTGHYTVSWVVTIAGTYEVKASWPGDARTDGSESEVLTVTVKGGSFPDLPPYVLVAIAAIAGSIIGSAVGALVLMRLGKPKTAQKTK